jgi:PAS domain S-box-containing protein
MVAPTESSILPELAPILGTVLDAVVIVTLEGRVIGWNGVAENTFGWAADEAMGQQLSELIIPPQHRSAHEEGIARLVSGAPPRVLNRRIEISALRANGAEFPVELSITATETADGPVFIGFLRDITRRRRAEEALRRQAVESRLMFDLAAMAAEADSFEEALAEGLAAICRLSGWPVGHAFTVTGPNPGKLVSTNIWHEAEPGAADAMREATARIAWDAGVGVPGTILLTGEPLWLTDTNETLNFFRKDAGFRGGFGFPLTCEGRIIAILEFFAHSPAPPDPQLLLTVRTLGEQVGRVFERRRRQDREALLIDELNHRAKNLLMVVQAIARQTFRKAASPELALEAFLGRLNALARAHDLLLASDLRDLDLRDAVEAAIEGCGNTLDRFEINGNNTRVPAGRGTTIVLAIHELCTNSVKYGSLSVPDGQVAVSWGRTPEGDQFAIEWRESGGPPVAPPERQGFGSTLLGRMLEAELGGAVEIDYAPDGLRYRFTTPLPRQRAKGASRS